MSDVSAASSSSTASLLAQLRQQFLSRLQSNGQNQNTVGAATQPGSVFSPPGAVGTSDPSSTSAAAATTGAAATSGASATPLSPNVLTVLILTQTQSSSGSNPSTGPVSATDGSSFQQQFFSSLDTNGDGSISQSELESAATSVGGTKQQADALFNKLDTNHDGSVSASELASADKPTGHGGGHHHHGAGGASASSGDSDPLAALTGSSSTDGTGATLTNPDGSTTTTLTYADGTTVTLTTPATNTTNTSSASGSSTSPSSTTPNANASGGTTSPPNPETLLTTLIRLQEQSFQPATQLGQAA